MKTPRYLHMTAAIAAILAGAILARGETVEPIKYGNMEHWVTRHIPESGLIGGNTKTLYAIGPTQTIDGAKPYVPSAGNPWGTSNVMAKVVGIVKGSNAVFPDKRESGGHAARLITLMETCRALGLVNIEVLVPGSIFTGHIIEPVKGTKNPYAKMDMGVPMTKRPKALQLDYKLEMPANPGKIYAPGFGKQKKMEGHDESEVYIILQRRWEDEDGNIYARRVGTGRERYGKSTQGWVNGHRIEVKYGDVSHEAGSMGLIPEERSYYATNSKGKLVPVKEVGWDDADATPTHMIVMASAGSGDAYVGTPGLTLWVDNLALVY